MKLPPEFLIMGAAKSGTTSLLADVKRHPQIDAPRFEVNYFSHRYEKGPDWYCSLFKEPGKVHGEKSTSYLCEKSCHQKIFSHNQAMKLIAILREPVKRAYSNWSMRHMQGRLLKQANLFNRQNDRKIENIGFSHLFSYFLNDEMESLRHCEPLDIFARGLYIDQVNSIYRFFPPDQLLILIAENYFENPARELKKVSRFLQIDDFPAGNHPWERKTDYPVKLDSRVARAMYDFYKPYNAQLFDLLGFEIPQWEQH